MLRAMDMAEVIRRRRAELGLSQADLAKAAGVDTRQIRRYEAGQQQPVLSVAVAIAKALGISVSELAGAPSHRVDLTGDWWTCWQTSRGGVEDIRTQPVQLDQHGELIQIEATARGRPVEEGGYLWRGELRLWDNEILMGWYAASDGSVRSKGTMYFVMHPHGISATGRWVGLSYDGNIVTGWSSMARTEADARDRSEERRVGKECRSRCDWSSDVCSSDLSPRHQRHRPLGRTQLRRQHRHRLEQHGPDRGRCQGTGWRAEGAGCRPQPMTRARSSSPRPI